MKKIDLLRAIQEIDTALDQIHRELEECRSRLGDDSELVPLRAEASAARSTLTALQEKGAKLDTEIETKRTKLKAQEKKLYDGSVKNPKDLSALDHEVKTEKDLISKLEDQALANMDALDEASAAEARASTTLSTTERQWQADQDALQSRCAELSSRDLELGSRRKEAVSPVDPQTLKMYDSVRRMRGGIAVVPVERGACQGCRISLSSGVVQKARAGADLVPCQNCGRFLYVL